MSAQGTNQLIFTEYSHDKSLQTTAIVNGVKKTNVRSNVKTKVSENVISLNPYIARNVILSKSVNTSENKQCLARFSSASSHLELVDGPSFESGKTDEYSSRKDFFQKKTRSSLTAFVRHRRTKVDSFMSFHLHHRQFSVE